MNRSRYEHLCQEAEAGRDAYVSHPDSNEEGMIDSCLMKSDHLVVNTNTGEKKCWDYRECEDLHRPKIGPMTY